MYQLYRIGSENPMQISSVVPVTCSDEAKELENLVVANTILLPGDQMAGDDEEAYRWMLIRQQMPVESASSGVEQLAVDLLFVDQFAWLTFVECKLRQNDESYRKVVGQMLEYVSSAQHYWTPGKLIKYLTQDRLEALAPAAHSLEEFCQLAIENLKAGRVRLVFLLDEAPRQLKAIATFLNEQLTETEVFVVELRHFTDQGRKFVMPLVFGYSQEALARRKEASGKWSADDFRGALMASAQSADERAALMRLVKFGECYPIHWGRGKQPACSVVTPSTAPRSMITFWANGDVTLNLDYMQPNDAERLRSALKQADIDFNVGQKFPGVKREAWTPHVDQFIAALENAATSDVAPSAGPGGRN